MSKDLGEDFHTWIMQVENCKTLLHYFGLRKVEVTVLSLRELDDLKLFFLVFQSRVASRAASARAPDGFPWVSAKRIGSP